MHRPLVAALAASALVLTAAAPALASPAAPQHRSVTATTFMFARPDSGGNGNWANDQFVRKVTLGAQTPAPASDCGEITGPCWQIDGAKLDDTHGSFLTIRDAFTPNQGAPFTGQHIRGIVQGRLSGTGTFGTFFATSLPSARRVPLVNLGSNNASSTWPELFFAPGTVFAGVSEGEFSYSYHAGAEHWMDSSTDGSGQQPGDGNITG